MRHLQAVAYPSGQGPHALMFEMMSHQWRASMIRLIGSSDCPPHRAETAERSTSSGFICTACALRMGVPFRFRADCRCSTAVTRWIAFVRPPIRTAAGVLGRIVL